MSRHESDADQIFPVEELAERYRGSFVVINVTEADESGWPTVGQFIASYRRRGWATRRMFAEMDKAKQQEKPYHGYIMPKEPNLKTVGEWRELLSHPTEEMLRI
ncbi:MAG: hypothetical protein Q7R49_06635 [Candidatus Daviesbacteria bacterium]|nr:hypothetical protein [Candidatus Daviesbacteria bacterium]